MRLLHPVGKAGLAYWALVFALGFLLGTIRVLFLEGSVGPLAATVIELPLMLAASWLAARWAFMRFAVSGTRSAFAMGMLAFFLLMGSELMLTIVMPGNSPGQWAARMGTPAGATGLLGQVLFGVIPMLADWTISRRGR